MNVLKQIKFIIALLLIAFSRSVFATDVEYCQDWTEMDPSIGCINAPVGIIDSYTSFYSLMIRVSDLMLVFAGSIAVIMLIISGLQYATAMGDDKKIDKSKRNMKWSAIGLLISLSAYWIVEFVLKNIV